MFKTAFSLELRKQRASFYGLVLVVVLGIFGAGMLGVLMGRWNFGDAQTGVWGALVAAVPLLAVTLGAISGGNLRKEPIKSIEEGFPVSPLEKVLAAYTSSLVYFALLAFVFPLMIFTKNILQAVSSIDAFGIFSRYPLFWTVLAATHFHFLAFAFSYWTKNAVVGAALALLTAGIEVGWAVIPVVHNLVFLSNIQPLRIIMLIVAWVTGIFAFTVIVRRLDRGLDLGFLRGVSVALGLIFGPLSSLLISALLSVWFVI